MESSSSGGLAVASAAISYLVPAVPAVPPGLSPGLSFRAVAHFFPVFLEARHLTRLQKQIAYHFSNYVKENINLALFIYLIQLIYPSLNIAAEDNWKSDSINRADAITYWVAAQPSRFNGIGRRHVALEVGFAPSAP